MQYLLSPAKRLDYESRVPMKSATTPQFLDRSAELIGVLKTKSAAQIAELMNLSRALSELNVARYAAWSPRFTARNSKPAVHAFDGDVYGGLDAATLGVDDLAWAQRHVAILSGLYGVLRPLDKLQPYRLEMGTPLITGRGRTLYDFWGESIAQHLNKRLAASESPVVVNLASQEYFRAVDRKALQARVVECVFEDWKSGSYKVISFFAKRARGLMARHAITHRVATPEGLKKFKAEGYAFDAAASAPERLVFRRRVDG
jgi:uncharacterized protein